MTLNIDQETFARQCKDAYQYMSSLITRADTGEKLQADELLTQLNSLVEELSVTGEELAQQAQELTITRDELASQRQHYEELFELAPDGYVVTDESGKIVESNKAATALLHLSKKHLFGKPLSTFISSADKQSFDLRFEQLIQSGKAISETWEETIQPRAGQPFRAIITAMCSLDGARRVHQIRWLIHDITLLRELEQQRQWLLGRLVTAHEEERARIARDLHDNMAQHLTALIIGLQSLKQSNGDSATGRTDVEKLQLIAESIGTEIHQIAKDLRPASLDTMGLGAAVSNFVHEWSEGSGIPVSMHGSGFGNEAAQISPEVDIAIYRIIQQALTNIQKHANATHVSIVLDKRRTAIQAIIEDNGVGFRPDTVMHQAASRQSLGLIGMRERAALVGGSVDIESKPGRGTTVFVRIPLPAQLAENEAQS